MVPVTSLRVRGTPKVYASSVNGRRSFCEMCGTGLFFTNAPLQEMGMVQVRIAALDEPEAIPPEMQVQTAEQIAWMRSLRDLPSVERFPS